MAEQRTVYQEVTSVVVEDYDAFNHSEFPPLCDSAPISPDTEECLDRSFDCSEALILVVPKGWSESAGFIEVNDYGYHLEGDDTCVYDLSKGSILMIPSWKA